LSGGCRKAGRRHKKTPLDQQPTARGADAASSQATSLSLSASMKMRCGPARHWAGQPLRSKPRAKRHEWCFNRWNRYLFLPDLAWSATPATLSARARNARCATSSGA